MKILIINGHPSESSFTGSLAKSYTEGARLLNATVDVLNLRDLKFDLSLHEGYREPMALEADLVRAQKLIVEAHQIVFFYPQWWGSAPALLKGFVDRVFLPGFAFKYHQKGPFWDRILTGRSGEIWLCSDSPRIWFLFKYWNSPIMWLKAATLEFCGIRPVKVHSIGRIRFLSATQKSKWLQRAFEIGKAQAMATPQHRTSSSAVLPT